MAKRKRNMQILFCVSPEEKKLIRRKMIESKTKNMGAYLRKMAIDGYIVNTDTNPLKKQYEEMHKIGVNINQIAKKVNSTGACKHKYLFKLRNFSYNFRKNLFGKFCLIAPTSGSFGPNHNGFISSAILFCTFR